MLQRKIIRPVVLKQIYFLNSDNLLFHDLHVQKTQSRGPSKYPDVHKSSHLVSSCTHGLGRLTMNPFSSAALSTSARNQRERSLL